MSDKVEAEVVILYDILTTPPLSASS